MPARIARIAAAIESGDRETVAREGHSLKGACLQIGAERLASPAAEWERGGGQSLVDEFRAEFARVEALIREEPAFR